MNTSYQKIIALLGPTNTGKTYVAIEKMLEFDTGIFGLPLRLLAREVYDKCVQKVGVEKVALITGEEKIIPSTANYFICTVESMPKDKKVDFIAIDEIQMCADRERGHIFTERLLESRGNKLTMFLGSQIMGKIINDLVKNVVFEKKERFSKLSYTGIKKISKRRCCNYHGIFESKNKELTSRSLPVWRRRLLNCNRCNRYGIKYGYK